MTQFASATLQLLLDSTKAKKGADEYKRAGEQVKKSNTDMQQSGKSAESGFASIAKGAAVAAASLFGVHQAVQAITGAFTTFAEFERQMNILGAVTRANSEEFIALDEIVRELGRTTRFTAREVAAGAIDLARGGLESAQIVAALPATLDLSTAGVLGLADAANHVTNIMGQFNIEAENMVRITDTLVAVSNRSNTNVEQLAGALSFAGITAQLAGVSIEETAVALGTLANRGIQGFRGGTQIRGILTALAKPTTAARKEFEKLGLTMGDLDVPSLGLFEVMDRMGQALNTLSSPTEKLASLTTIFNRRMAASAQIMANSADEMRGFRQEVADSEGEARRTAAAVEAGLGGAMDRLKSAAEGAALGFADIFDGGVIALMDGAASALGEITTGMRQLNKELEPARDNFSDLFNVIHGFALGLSVSEVQQLIQTMEDAGNAAEKTGTQFEDARFEVERMSLDEVADKIGSFKGFDKLQTEIEALATDISGYEDAFDGFLAPAARSAEELEEALFQARQASRRLDIVQTLIKEGEALGQVYDRNKDLFLEVFEGVAVDVTKIADEHHRWETSSAKIIKDAQEMDKFYDSLGDTIASSFEDAIFEVETWNDALAAARSLLEDISRILLRKAVTEPLAGFFGDVISGLGGAVGGILGAGGGTPSPTGPGYGGAFHGFAQGGILGLNGAVTRAASGAMITHPTMLGLPGGNRVLAGEYGGEGIFPLVKGPKGLGIQASGAGGSPVVNHNSFQVTMAPGSTEQDFRRSQPQIQRQMSEMWSLTQRDSLQPHGA